MSVRVYVEGGGDYKHTDTSTACRRGFAELFEKLGLAGRNPRVIPCGGRGATFKDFRTAVRQATGGFVILLVDSEGRVAANFGSWAYLKTRDKWKSPAGATDDQAHMMVQCMEAWFLADKNALNELYGPEFLAGSLPGQLAIEEIPRKELVAKL